MLIVVGLVGLLLRFVDPLPTAPRIAAGNPGYRGIAYVGRRGPKGPYLFRLEPDETTTASGSRRTAFLEVDPDGGSAKEWVETNESAVGSGNARVPLIGRQRSGGFDVYSWNGHRWKSEGSIAGSPLSNLFFTEDAHGALWAVLRSGTSRAAEVVRQVGDRWRSLLHVDQAWTGDPVPDSSDPESIDWGLLEISAHGGTRRWADLPSRNEPWRFLFRKLPGDGEGAAIRMDGTREAFVWTQGKWVRLQSGPWEPGLSSSVSPLDDLTGFDTREVILRWPVSRQRTVYGRVTAAGWKDLLAIQSGHEEAWREPRILVRHGSGSPPSLFGFGGWGGGGGRVLFSFSGGGGPRVGPGGRVSPGENAPFHPPFGGGGAGGCHPEERSDEGSALFLDEGTTKALQSQGRSFAALRMTR